MSGGAGGQPIVCASILDADECASTRPRGIAPCWWGEVQTIAGDSCEPSAPKGQCFDIGDMDSGVSYCGTCAARPDGVYFWRKLDGQDQYEMVFWDSCNSGWGLGTYVGFTRCGKSEPVEPPPAACECLCTLPDP